MKSKSDDIIITTDQLNFYAKDTAINFINWLHNNWYEPTGTDFYWRLKVEDIEYTLEIPPINLFLPEELYEKFLQSPEI